MVSKQPFETSNLEAWQASGQTQSAYCREGASLGQLWILAAQAAARRGIDQPMAVTTSPCDTSLEVTLPNRLSAKVPMTAEPARVAA